MELTRLNLPFLIMVEIVQTYVVIIRHLKRMVEKIVIHVDFSHNVLHGEETDLLALRYPR